MVYTVRVLKSTDTTEVPGLAVGWSLSARPDGLCVLFEVDSEYSDAVLLYTVYYFRGNCVIYFRSSHIGATFVIKI